MLMKDGKKMQGKYEGSMTNASFSYVFHFENLYIMFENFTVNIFENLD